MEFKSYKSHGRDFLVSLEDGVYKQYINDPLTKNWIFTNESLSDQSIDEIVNWEKEKTEIVFRDAVKSNAFCSVDFLLGGLQIIDGIEIIRFADSRFISEAMSIVSDMKHGFISPIPVDEINCARYIREIDKFFAYVDIRNNNYFLIPKFTIEP